MKKKGGDYHDGNVTVVLRDGLVLCTVKQMQDKTDAKREVHDDGLHIIFANPIQIQRCERFVIYISCFTPDSSNELISSKEIAVRNVQRSNTDINVLRYFACIFV